jgi:hypothetical protein
MKNWTGYSFFFLKISCRLFVYVHWRGDTKGSMCYLGPGDLFRSTTSSGSSSMLVSAPMLLYTSNSGDPRWAACFSGNVQIIYQYLKKVTENKRNGYCKYRSVKGHAGEYYKSFACWWCKPASMSVVSRGGYCCRVNKEHLWSKSHEGSKWLTIKSSGQLDMNTCKSCWSLDITCWYSHHPTGGCTGHLYVSKSANPSQQVLPQSNGLDSVTRGIHGEY